MAPIRTKKRKSSARDAKENVKTPKKSPIKKPMMITQGQKQALIDNLQLEITERARKLRAQYALQAQSLRTRVEMRVNRIPTALRKANMGELLDKYMESLQTEKAKTISKASKSKIAAEKVPSIPQQAPPVAELRPPLDKNNTRTRGMKRKSDEMDQADKENTPDPSQAMPAPKKRVKPAIATARQDPNPSTVLSPKSSNSRTLPRSPIRPLLGAPPKPQASRPASPLKPPSPIKTAATVATSTLANMVDDKLRGNKPLAGAGRKASKTTTAEAIKPAPAVTRSKRGAATNAAATIETGHRTVSNSSNVSGTSGTSTGTTIVKRMGRAMAPRATAAATTKKGVGVSAAGKKVAKAKAEAPPAGRRVLRKRA